jgi:hypothetical protein
MVGIVVKILAKVGDGLHSRRAYQRPTPRILGIVYLNLNRDYVSVHWQIKVKLDF